MIQQNRYKQPTADSNKIVNPPIWLNQIGYWFRIGVTIFTALSLLLGTVACTNSSSATTAPASWQLADRVIPKKTLTRIVREHSNLSYQMQVKKPYLSRGKEGEKGRGGEISDRQNKKVENADWASGIEVVAGKIW